MNVTIALLGLGLLIFVHESGHFFTSLVLGMRPRRFYIGFPPALVKVRRGGIEYGIGAIPLGGFVKIPGMHRPSRTDVDAHFRLSLHEQASLLAPAEALKRNIDSGDLVAAQSSLTTLATAIGDVHLSPAAQKGARRGLAELGDALGADAYWRAATWRRVAVIAAGPLTNILFAVILFSLLFMFGAGKATTTIDQVLDGRPAASAGLHPGDRIVAIDHRRVERPAQIPQLISGSKGRPLLITVERGGRPVPVGPVRARKDGGAYRLGFVLRGVGLSPPAAVWASVRLTGLVSKQIVTTLGNLIHRQGRKEISSTVGIVQGSSAALSQGAQNYLWVLGLISLSLALLNLLPLLPLDGGHILFSIIEGIRGRAVGREIYERVSAVGIALVLMLWFIGLSNDIGRLGGG